jgi:hypothetical protein
VSAPLDSVSRTFVLGSALGRKGSRPSRLYFKRSGVAVGGGSAAGVAEVADELARFDAPPDDPVFFSPFEPFFDPRIGLTSTPMETYLRSDVPQVPVPVGVRVVVPGSQRFHHLAAALPDSRWTVRRYIRRR